MRRRRAAASVAEQMTMYLDDASDDLKTLADVLSEHVLYGGGGEVEAVASAYRKEVVRLVDAVRDLYVEFQRDLADIR